jgi:hypothetical protein
MINRSPFIAMLAILLSVAQASAKDDPGQCGVCDEEDKLILVWYPTHGWQWEWVLHHALGYDNFIVHTFEGDGPTARGILVAVTSRMVVSAIRAAQT